jgi:hypothetical protein
MRIEGEKPRNISDGGNQSLNLLLNLAMTGWKMTKTSADMVLRTIRSAHLCIIKGSSRGSCFSLSIGSSWMVFLDGTFSTAFYMLMSTITNCVWIILNQGDWTIQRLQEEW